MDYLEKLSKQHEFIYFIGGKYYVCGNRACIECDYDKNNIEYSYKRYCENVNKELSREFAWKLFYRLNSRALTICEENGRCDNVEEEIKKYNFNECEIRELQDQMDKYLKFFIKYKIGLKLKSIGR